MQSLFNVINYLLGGGLLIVAAVGFANAAVIPALFFFLAALLIIPAIRKKIHAVIHIPMIANIALVVALVIAAGIAMPPSNQSPKYSGDNQTTENESVQKVADNSATTDKVDTSFTIETEVSENLRHLRDLLNQPPLGTSYSEMKDACSREPSSSGNADGHYSCSSVLDKLLTSSGKLVFGPDKLLKAKWFRFRTDSDSADFVSQEVILAELDSVFGSRQLTQNGERRFRLQNQTTTFSAISYGCKAYFVDKPGMQIPGGTPKTHRTIWEETGTVLDLDSAERFDFEVIKNEVLNVDRCVIALVNYGGTNIPRGINEEQDYKAEVHVMEIAPTFALLNSKGW